MSNASQRAYIVQQIKLAATLYRRNLVGNSYLYVFDNRYIEVLYRAQSFRHLTGVDTSLSAMDFYRQAARGQLGASQIYFTRQHPYDLCMRKIRHICNISSLVTSESFMLEEIITSTRTYTFGTTNMDFSLCLDREYDKQGMPIGDHYLAMSLRDGDNFGRSKNVYDITHIFCKSNSAKKYTNLCYMDKNSNLADLPEAVRALIDI